MAAKPTNGLKTRRAATGPRAADGLVPTSRYLCGDPQYRQRAAARRSHLHGSVRARRDHGGQTSEQPDPQAEAAG